MTEPERLDLNRFLHRMELNIALIEMKQEAANARTREIVAWLEDDAREFYDAGLEESGDVYRAFARRIRERHPEAFTSDAFREVAK